MSLEAFISGKCAVTSSGVIVPNSNPVERRRADENSLETMSTTSSTNSRSRRRDPPTAADNNNNNSTARSSSDANNIVLAERTSNLINSYRDYVSGLDGYDIEELMISRDNDQHHGSSTTSLRTVVGASSTSSSSNSNNHNLRDYRQSIDTSPPSPLLRGWNHTNTSNQNYSASAMSNRCDYEPPYSDYDYNDEENNFDRSTSIEQKKYRYTHPIYHSKKFKQSLVICVLVGTVALIGWASSSASNSSRERQKDLHLEDALKHYEMKTPTTTTSELLTQENEEVDGEQNEPTVVTKAQEEESGDTASSEEEIESVTRHILCCSSSPSSSSSASSSISVKTEYLLAESHHPVWYTRSDGWMGTTWQEAREFCSSRGNSNSGDVDDGTVVELCPYEVYCPTGPHHIPYGGYRVDESASNASSSSSRAPISDLPNGWVQVGSDNACVQYSMIGSDSSSSSVDANKNEDALAMIEEVVHDVSTVNQISTHDTTESQVVVDIVEDTDATTTTSDIQSDSQVESTEPTVTSINQSSSFDMTSTLHRKFKPFWLSSNDGWNGGSYDDAVEFCSSIRGKQLCPYSVMCPHGPQNAVMGGYRRVEFEVDGEQYAPILGGENHWVMIGNMELNDDGTSSKCMTHRQLEGKAPEWGLNDDRKELKKYIMCCTVN